MSTGDPANGHSRIAALESALENERRAREHAEQRLAEQQARLDLLMHIADAANATADSRQALSDIVELICRSMGWPVGHVFMVDSPDSHAITSSNIWFARDPGQVRPFQVATENIGPHEDSGLPRTALESAKPVWVSRITDDSPIARREAALHCDIHGALAFPVAAGGTPLAVLEFFTYETAEPDAFVMEIMEQAGIQLGRVFEREHALEVRELYAYQLQRNAEELARFLNIAAHDLQEPLRKIELFASRLLALDDAVLPPRGRDHLARLGTAVRRMSGVMGDLLALLRTSAEPLQEQVVDLDEVMAECTNAVDSALQECAGHMTVQPLPRIRADRNLCVHLFRNLLENAVLFRRPDQAPRIGVDWKIRDDECFEIRVSDNGIGFENQFAATIFEPFERLHAEDDYPGNGIGLAICRRAVERMDGRIEAHSAGPGRGATFTCVLPGSRLPEGCAP